MRTRSSNTNHRRNDKTKRRSASVRRKKSWRGGTQTARADAQEGMRLQKVMAAAGIGSRRHCEQLITEGRVDVDGKTVTELGTRVDPAEQKIVVDGELLRSAKRKLYFLINKPVGIISTNYDPAGRPRVIDLAPTEKRLFTVGRLDKSSSGLILATNDGALTDLLTHPRYGVEKTYLAQVVGVPSREALAKLQQGVHLAEGFAHADRVHVRRTQRQSTLLEIVLSEGRNREVRRLLARLGHKVISLRRIALGPLRLGDLQPGESRPLRSDEVEALYQAAQERKSRSKQPRKERAAGISQGKQPDQTGADHGEKLPTVRPLVDLSLSDDEGDEDVLDLTGVMVGDIEVDPLELEEETTTVDLRPLTRDSRKSPPLRTIIGADRGKARSKSDDQKGRRKPHRNKKRQHRGKRG